MAKKKKPLTAKQRSARAKKAWKKQWKTETVEQWKARLKKHRAKIKREKSPEFKRRSEAGKKGWQTRKLKKETGKDVYDGIMADIYAKLPQIIADKLSDITKRYMTQKYGWYDYYSYACDLPQNQIANDLGNDDKVHYITLERLIQLFEHLTGMDEFDYMEARRDLSDLYEQYYSDWLRKYK